MHYRPATFHQGPSTLYTINFNYKHNSLNGHTNNSTTQHMDNSNNNSGSNNKNVSIVVLYIHGLGGKFKRTCNSLGIQAHFRGTNTIQTLLMASKDRNNKLQKTWDIYRFKCPHINRQEEYIEESGRSFWDHLKEHLRAPSPIYQHNHSTGHLVSPDCFTIVNRQPQGFTRNIKGAMYI